MRDVAQLGSAPLWGSGGRGFKSRRSDFKQKQNPYSKAGFLKPAFLWTALSLLKP